MKRIIFCLFQNKRRFRKFFLRLATVRLCIMHSAHIVKMIEIIIREDFESVNLLYRSL